MSPFVLSLSKHSSISEPFDQAQGERKQEGKEEERLAQMRLSCSLRSR